MACLFAAGTATITFAPGDAITVLRSVSQIHENGAPCGIGPLVAEVTTTDTITFVGVATGSETLTIDLSGGPFAPAGPGASRSESVKRTRGKRRIP